MRRLHKIAKIISNKRIGPCYYKLELGAPEIARLARPGNFIMVKITRAAKEGLTGPLLRRPLSVHKVAGKASGRVELLYEAVGAGTKILSQKKAGEELDLLGPLGSGFDIDASARLSGALLVCGGIGAAPLVFLAQKLAQQLKGRGATVLIGARTKSQILCVSDFKKLGLDVKIATDDGTAGFHGRVTGLLDKILSAGTNKIEMLYGCGPAPMLKAMSEISRKSGVPAQVSLESHMACGIGACLGCVVRTRNGYKRVCKEGPVFLANELLW
ncbi:MAG: dihydroorotate dehydrogenase electron transfer subunit [Candidatus Omnitrophica bacterium]|jgi:dihydroorotate dehydrogenase electron transfer subunit|nr:dihydroorotate dehydrogenase electron transfer subunit [Candidatus Omnitrophota bacterium]